MLNTEEQKKGWRVKNRAIMHGTQKLHEEKWKAAGREIKRKQPTSEDGNSGHFSWASSHFLSFSIPFLTKSNPINSLSNISTKECRSLSKWHGRNAKAEKHGAGFGKGSAKHGSNSTNGRDMQESGDERQHIPTVTYECEFYCMRFFPRPKLVMQLITPHIIRDKLESFQSHGPSNGSHNSAHLFNPRWLMIHLSLDKKSLRRRKRGPLSDLKGNKMYGAPQKQRCEDWRKGSHKSCQLRNWCFCF